MRHYTEYCIGPNLSEVISYTLASSRIIGQKAQRAERAKGLQFKKAIRGQNPEIPDIFCRSGNNGIRLDTGHAERCREQAMSQLHATAATAKIEENQFHRTAPLSTQQLLWLLLAVIIIKHLVNVARILHPAMLEV